MRYLLTIFLLLVWLPFDVAAKDTASTAETKFVEVEGVRLGYREVGSGDPIIMFTRLRGTIDTWDPAFVDALADGYRVIMVDYPGVGYSEGDQSAGRRGGAYRLLNIYDGWEATFGSWPYRRPLFSSISFNQFLSTCIGSPRIHCKSVIIKAAGDSV